MPITQASKTIIFERFNEAYGLAQMVNTNNEKCELTQNDLKKIEEELSVSSFEEFLEKFRPVIYERQVINNQGKLYFEYSLEKPREKHDVIDITSHQFFKMALSLYQKKGASGQSNLDFDFDTAKEILTPKAVQDQIRSIRLDLIYSMNKYYEYENSDPDKASEYLRQCKYLLRQIKNEFFTGSARALLPVVLSDTMDKIKYIESRSQTSGNGVVVETPRLESCTISYTEEGRLDIRPVPPEELYNEDVKRLNGANETIVKLLGSGYDKAHENAELSTNVTPNQFIKNTIISVFSGTKNNMAMPDYEELKQMRDEYIETYKTMQEAFAEQMVALIEKILNVKAFFDHAGNAKIIIANCTIKELLTDAKRKKDFAAYINRLGREHTDEKIWYAVVPAIMDKDFEDIKNDNLTLEDLEDMFGDDEEDEDTKKSDKTGVSFDDLKNFLGILETSKITTFFNFKGNEITSFGNLNDNLVRGYKEKTSQISEASKAGAVFCYPNFTIMPKSKRRYKLYDDPETYIDSPSIYLDASYIACAMMIQAHDNDILIKKGYQVTDKSLPAVRFDYESSFMNKNYNGVVPCWAVMTTKMNKENVYSWTPELKKEINEDGGFGFCFCGDDISFGGREIANTYVFKARTLAKQAVKDSNGEVLSKEYSHLFKRFVKVFLEAYYEGNDLATFKNSISKWSHDADMKNINNPIYNISNVMSGENFKESIEISGSNVTIKYGRNDEKLDIQITDGVAASSK